MSHFIYYALISIGQLFITASIIIFIGFIRRVYIQYTSEKDFHKSAAILATDIASHIIITGVNPYVSPVVRNYGIADQQAHKLLERICTVSLTGHENTIHQETIRMNTIMRNWLDKIYLMGSLAQGGSDAGNKALRKQLMHIFSEYQ